MDKNKNSTTFRAVKTIRVNGKNKTLVVRTFGSDRFICETYGVTDAKAWAKEQVRLMNEAEKEDSATFNIELCAGTDLVMDEQRRFNGGYLFLQNIYYEPALIRYAGPFPPDIFLSMTSMMFSHIWFIRGFFIPHPKGAVSKIPEDLLNSLLLNFMMFTVPSLS